MSEIPEPIMSPEELVRKIREFGFTMFVGEDGVVHGRPTVPGRKVPLAMQPLLDELRLQNDAVAQILRGDQKYVELNGITTEEAAPWLAKVKAGEYRLVPGTKVTYVKSTGLAYLKLEKVSANG